MKTPATEVMKSLRKRMPIAQGREYDTLTEERPRNDKQTGFTSITSRFLSLPGVRIHPTLDRVLVEYEEIAETTKGGILIPSTAQTRKQGGSYPVKVLAVGHGRWGWKDATMFKRWPMSYAPGDRAMAPCLNFPLFMDGREVYLVNEDALLGKLECHDVRGKGKVGR